MFDGNFPIKGSKLLYLFFKAGKYVLMFNIHLMAGSGGCFQYYDIETTMTITTTTTTHVRKSTTIATQLTLVPWSW